MVIHAWPKMDTFFHFSRKGIFFTDGKWSILRCLQCEFIDHFCICLILPSHFSSGNSNRIQIHPWYIMCAWHVDTLKTRLQLTSSPGTVVYETIVSHPKNFPSRKNIGKLFRMLVTITPKIRNYFLWWLADAVAAVMFIVGVVIVIIVSSYLHCARVDIVMSIQMTWTLNESVFTLRS